MIHVRVVAPSDRAQAVLGVLSASLAVVHVVHLPGAARKPDGDVILCESRARTRA